MSDIETRSTNTPASSRGRLSLTASLYSLALSVNTILPEYTASEGTPSEYGESNGSFEQEIGGETYRFQVLSEQNVSRHQQVISDDSSSIYFDSSPVLGDSPVPPPRYSTLAPSSQSSYHTAREPAASTSSQSDAQSQIQSQIDSQIEGPQGTPAENQNIQHFEHSTVVQDKKPWATILIFTPESIPGMPEVTRFKPNIPTVYGGKPVLGLLELNLDSPKAIEQITITLQGKVRSGYVDVSTKILESNYVVWHKSKGDPRQRGSNRERSTREIKLVGSYQFPFSFRFQNASEDTFPGAPTSPIDERSLAPVSEEGSSSQLVPGPSSTSKFSFRAPRSAVVEKKRMNWSLRQSASTNNLRQPRAKPAPLPPSFNERGVQASIEYTLSVRIQRRLRPDTIIKTPVTYVPSIFAEPASAKRQRAYTNGEVAPGPFHDPEGWSSLPQITIRGRVNRMPFHIDCILFVPQPRSFTRGTVLPCYLEFRSRDIATLRNICTPSTPMVRLVRRLRHFNPKKLQDKPTNTITPFRDYEDENAYITTESNMALAVWRNPPKDALEALSSNACYIEGEIHLPENLQPTYSSRLFSIEYHIELLPLVSTLFEPSPLLETKYGKGVLVSGPVKITTLHPPETPIPIGFSEPMVEYTKAPDAPKEPEWKNYALDQFGLI